MTEELPRRVVSVTNPGSLWNGTLLCNCPACVRLHSSMVRVA